MKEPDHKYPLDLVADVATRLLTADGKADYSLTMCKRAADYAMRILDACKVRLEEDSAREEEARRSRDEHEADLTYMESHGKNVPWKTGLLDITGKKSEAEAIGPFKLWSRYELAHRKTFPSSGIPEHLLTPLPRGWIEDKSTPPEWAKDGADDIEYKIGEVLKLQAEVETKIRTLRTEGFAAHDVPGQGRAFKEWYKEVGIPAVRGLVARTPARKKAKKTV